MKTLTSVTPKESIGPGNIRFSPKQHFVDSDTYKLLKENFSVEETAYIQEFSNAADIVSKHYQLPYPLYDFQKAWLNAFGDCEGAGMYFEVGTGKTITAIAASLYHKILDPETVVIVLMPPILLNQWQENLLQIPNIGKVQIYAGIPSVRNKIDLNVSYLLMTIEIFKNDFEKLYNFYLDKPVTLLVDEATSIKNINTGNYKAVKAFMLKASSVFLQHKTKKASARANKAQRQLRNNDVNTSSNDLFELLKDKYGLDS